MMTPAKVERLDGYVRVSRVGARDMDAADSSPEVQRKIIARWAEMRGVEIATWHEDLDQSGGKLSRPGLDAMMARIRAGETGGCAVAYLSRLSRAGVGDALKLVEEIHEHGGRLAAVDLGIDPTTEVGEFALTIMLALARMERRRLAAGWERAKGAAIGRGVKISRAPFGYRADEDGRLEPSEDAPTVAEAYRLAAAEGLPAAVAMLQREAPGRRWTATTARRLLANRTYLGESHYGEQANADAHPALVNAGTFLLAQTKPGAQRAPSKSYPLSGIAKCGTCGARMTGANAGKGQRTYRCSAYVSRRSNPNRDCAAPAMVLAAPLDALAFQIMLDVAERGEPGQRGYVPGHRIGEPEAAELLDAQLALDVAQAELGAYVGDVDARAIMGDTDLYTAQVQSRPSDVNPLC